MKRTVFAVILLFICVGICLLSDISVEKYTQELMTVLEETQKDLYEENLEKARDRIVEADEKWERAELLFSSLSDSLLVENMDLYFNSLPLYIECGQKEEALIVIGQCKTTLREILNWQKVNIKNIF